MAIDPCVFVCGHVDSFTHIQAFHGIQAKGLGDNLCAILRVSVKSSKSCRSQGCSSDTLRIIFNECVRGHACAAVCRELRLQYSSSCSLPSHCFSRPVLNPQPDSVFHLTHRTQPRKGKRVRLQSRLRSSLFSLLVLTLTISGFIVSPPSSVWEFLTSFTDCLVIVLHLRP